MLHEEQLTGVDAEKLAGSHVVTELTFDVWVGAFSSGEIGIGEISKMCDLLDEKIKGDIPVPC